MSEGYWLRDQVRALLREELPAVLREFLPDEIDRALGVPEEVLRQDAARRSLPAPLEVDVSTTQRQVPADVALLQDEVARLRADVNWWRDLAERTKASLNAEQALRMAFERGCWEAQGLQAALDDWRPVLPLDSFPGETWGHAYS